ncbi:MAG: segregation/condensation protein A [Armatimonadetes bacterium]|nr:segregation/condensation protein A [Armatimonadota bacterium]
MNFVRTEDSPYKVTLEIFQGPLDLLLHLIRENEIDIYDIPIAKVTEQYLAYLSLMESLDLEVAGEWLVMAATLVEIKSRMLLPEEPGDEADEEERLDPRLELVERLIEYEKFKGAAEIFREREEMRSKVFSRGTLELDFDLKPTVVLDNITASDLLSLLQNILSDVGKEPVTSIQRRKITVRMRMREIWRKVSQASGQLSFEELFDDVYTKVEVVITFLALLELLKAQSVKVKQTKAFATIKIIPLTEPNGR